MHASLHMEASLSCNAGSLDRAGRQLVCEGLVTEDKAIWLQPEKEKRRCLVTRQPIRIWAATIVNVVNVRFTSKTMTIENLFSGEDVAGTGAASALAAHLPASCLSATSCDFC
jgi:hypothetical protein